MSLTFLKSLKQSMMKIKLLVVFLISSLSANAQSEFEISGKIKGLDSGFLKLAYPSIGGKFVQDSAKIEDGNFKFIGKLNGPEFAYLIGPGAKMQSGDPNMGFFFLEPGKLDLELELNKFNKLVLKGSRTQDEFAELESKKLQLSDKIMALSSKHGAALLSAQEARKSNKTETQIMALQKIADNLKDQIEPYQQEIRLKDLDFIKAHPDSYVSVYLLGNQISFLSLEVGRGLYNSLAEKLKKTMSGQRIAGEIKEIESGSPGSTASVFTSNDLNGLPISLQDFRGSKYVLLDFWASWCVPCRKGNPHMLALYSMYKNKGLEIIGVSDDDNNVNAWKKAVEQDKIGVWKHILRGYSRGHGGQDINSKYGISSLPTKILIDKSGVIVGRYGGGGQTDEELDKKLASLLH